MGEPARQEVSIKQFAGMATNVDRTDIKPGVSVIQVNVNATKVGQIEVRGGLRPLRFEES